MDGEERTRAGGGKARVELSEEALCTASLSWEATVWDWKDRLYFLEAAVRVRTYFFLPRLRYSQQACQHGVCAHFFILIYLVILCDIKFFFPDLIKNLS